MAFLPQNIKAPSEGNGGSGNYMRFVQGENKFRIIGASEDKPTPGFIHGTLGWAVEDGKKRPIRWADGEQAPQAFEDKPRAFYAFVVYNYNESKVQILEMTQVKLQAELLQLAQDEDWGDCRKYDIRSAGQTESKHHRHLKINPGHSMRSWSIIITKARCKS